MNAYSDGYVAPEVDPWIAVPVLIVGSVVGATLMMFALRSLYGDWFRE